jgi:hypothetical protein
MVFSVLVPRSFTVDIRRSVVYSPQALSCYDNHSCLAIASTDARNGLSVTIDGLFFSSFGNRDSFRLPINPTFQSDYEPY